VETESLLPPPPPPPLNPGFRDSGLRVGELNDVEESIWRFSGLGGDRMATMIYSSLRCTSIPHVIAPYTACYLSQTHALYQSK